MVKFERVKEVVEFSVFSRFIESNIVLLQTVEGKLRLVIDVNFKRLHTQQQETTVSMSFDIL